MSCHSIELPYTPDAAELFEPLAGLPWAALLDSGPEGGRRGRYDILVAAPRVTLVSDGRSTCIERAGVTGWSEADPFALLAAELARFPTDAPPAGLPFFGGAVGYFGYDLARRLLPLQGTTAQGEAMPDMAVGLYDAALILDHERRRAVLAGLGPESVARLQALLRRPRAPTVPFAARSAVTAATARRGYDAAFARIRAWLRAGDCYQVNYAQRFSVPVEGDPWEGYRRLRERNPAPFAAYLATPFGAVLSCSPERFLRVAGGQVETRPIKGTVARLADPDADRAAREWLAASAKDRAENLMIVDLLRNDLGKCCEVGSVQVPRLFEVESFATVHHLVSTVTGRLASGRHVLDLLRDCFPGGSVTGAPKRRAMEIIDTLESHRRGVYCGAIGYVGFDGGMDTNIAIRTLTVRGGEAVFWAGGGIVYDSSAEAEYAESLAKARAFLDFFGAAAD